MDDTCPRCRTSGQPVPLGLVRHHLARPWALDLEGKAFSFCEEPGCDVVYWSSDGRAYASHQLRRAPAYKSGDEADLLCFCFDVSGRDALSAEDPAAYVRERVRNAECACDVLNPSGACCLGSIGRWRNARAQERAGSER